MYCVKCGVKLADTEIECPLCGTVVYHPDITREKGESLYPGKKYPRAGITPRWPQVMFTVAFLLPLIIVLMCDMQFNGGVTWSGYVMGALILGYVSVVLPTWFKKPNPVIFVPCDFVVTALYLLYISVETGGGWFLSFALPVVCAAGAIVITVVTLVYYLRRGKFFIFGGAMIALGVAVLLMEFLMSFTFEGVAFIGWSFYPLVTLVILGGALIFLGAYRPARESMEKKFFI